MQLPPNWRFRFKSPSWMNFDNTLSEDPPSFGYKDFEGELKIPEHVHKYIDAQFMADWMDSIKRYAEFEFQKLLDERSKAKSRCNCRK